MADSIRTGTSYSFPKLRKIPRTAQEIRALKRPVKRNTGRK
jgi:hypothetical protein